MKIRRENIGDNAQQVLTACLQNISLLRIESIQKNITWRDQQIDFLVQLESSGKIKKLLVATQTSGEPRSIRAGVNQLLRLVGNDDAIYPIILAPFISPAGAKICQDAGIGYIDFSGNCAIQFDQVYIEKEGRPNRFSEKRALKSLFNPKGERILRVLLSNPGQCWKMQTLADAAQVSLGLCAKVKQRLEEMEWIKADKIGFTLVRGVELLQSWQNNYDYKEHVLENFYALEDTAAVEKKIAGYCETRKITYSLTMFGGASRVAPYTRTSITHVYIDGSVADVANELGLKSVASGANVVLIVPLDAGVFYARKKYDDVYVASTIQLYLDLMSYRGRGEDAAKFLYTQEIEPLWLPKPITEDVK